MRNLYERLKPEHKEELEHYYKELPILLGELKKDLRENHRVKFEFVKKDGTIREANGTLHPVILDEYVKGTGTAKVRHDVVKYFDLDKNQFRSFNAMNLIG